MGRLGYSSSAVGECAAKAIFYVHLTAFICVKSCQRIERSLKNIRAVDIIRIKCKKYTWARKIPEVCMLGKNRRNIR
jgi:hypothetical protein